MATPPEITEREAVQLGRKVRGRASDAKFRARWRLWLALWKASDGWHAKGSMLRVTARKAWRKLTTPGS
jgi:hypothetical protein